MVGLAAGLLAAISAPLVTYEHYLLTETLFAFSVTGDAGRPGLGLPTRQAGDCWLLGGVLVGLAAMVKPMAQGFLPLARASQRMLVGRRLAAARRAGCRGRRRRAPRCAVALVAVGYGLAVAPWSIRNQLAYNLASPSTFGRTLIARTASYDRGFVFVDPSRPESDPRMARAARIVQQGADRGDSGWHDRPAAAPGA